MKNSKMKRGIIGLITAIMVYVMFLPAFAWNSDSAASHAKAFRKALKTAGFFTANARKQKVIATNVILAREGTQFEEIDQDKVITMFYIDKYIAYQFVVSYNSDGLMELRGLNILYGDDDTGKICCTEIIK
jgi:hypothetical protein